MAVRIIEQDRNGNTVIRVDGWLDDSEEASELLRVVRSAPGPVAVDLKELRTADASGVAALNTLVREGVKLSRASDYIKLLLGGRIEETEDRRVMTRTEDAS